MRIQVVVSNDLVTDQRVIKMCHSLFEWGHEIYLTGRFLPGSPPLPHWSFKAKRMRLLFIRGPLFYTELNIRLFFRLLFLPTDIIHANDLDVLLPCYLVSKIRKKKLIYDTHEYFTGVPELQKRPLIRGVWKRIERFIFPKLNYIITVNDSIAGLYEKEYSKKIQVVRNIPTLNVIQENNLTRKDLAIPEDKFIIIMQGNGINVHRGAEEAAEMMNYLNDCFLIIAGSGDVIPNLKEFVLNHSLQDRILFLPRMPYDQLMKYTQLCDLGLSLDKDSNINYQYSLPNKIFDYLLAGIPVMASDLIEVRKVIEQTGGGFIVKDLTPEKLAEEIMKFKNDRGKIEKIRLSIANIKINFSWEKEVEPIKNWYR